MKNRHKEIKNHLRERCKLTIKEKQDDHKEIINMTTKRERDPKQLLKDPG